MEKPTASSPLTVLPGIGPMRAKAFAAAGIQTLSDLLHYFPRAYENRGVICQLRKCDADNHVASYLLTVSSEPKNVMIRSDMILTKFRAFDDCGAAEVVFFNQPYLKDAFHPGEIYRFFGRLCINRSHLQLTSPKFEKWEEGKHLPDYISVYSAIKGLNLSIITGAVMAALDLVLPSLPDPLPEDIRERTGLMTLADALRTVHVPKTHKELDDAVRRLAFDELFSLSLCSAVLRTPAATGHAPVLKSTALSPFLAALPYQLTAAQTRVCREIAQDLSASRGVPMNRILIGDVGCGKTVCAAAAIYLAAKNGHQAALMAPTEILAEQHYADLGPLFRALGFRVELLTGATTPKEKDRIYRALASEDQGDRTDIVIGTHALLSDKVVFSDLALTVTDEQHRFGVLQRAALKRKNRDSHLLVMSATPIPRTLALAMYGDIAVSRIDEMPKGRKRVSTFHVDRSYRERMNKFIRTEIASGGQAYVVCPAIESKRDIESGEVQLSDLYYTKERPDTEVSLQLYERIAETHFLGVPMGFLHGRMKAAEKDAVMADFISGKIKVLVSTTVIEVGVNVPSASVMVVENAECFGLSQLHQLRGRVGRGTRKSYCFLLSDVHEGKAAERLDTLCTTYDGYEIAEADLRLRGPGDFFATAFSDTFRQSGGMDLHFATFSNPELTALVSTEAEALLRRDPYLRDPAHAALRRSAEKMFHINAGTVS